MSDDGGWVLFRSLAADLVAGQIDVEHDYDLFLFERASGAVTLVSHTAASAITAAEYEPSDWASLSGDGRFVVYSSTAGDLVAGFDDRSSTPYGDVYLFDRTTGAHTLVSHLPGSAASTGNGGSSIPEISQDGSAVVFTSEASDLAASPLDANELPDVLLYEVAAGTSAVVSVRDPGLPSHAAGGSASAVSPDGRWVVFLSNGQVLPGQADANHGADLFLLDRATNTTILVSRAAGATPLTTADAPSGPGAVSADGRWVVFTSEATNLAAGQTDVNPMADVFLFDRDTGLIALVSHAAGSVTTTGNDHSWNPVISADGAFIAYESRAPAPTPSQPASGASDVFLHDRVSQSTWLISHLAGQPTTAAGNSSETFTSVLGLSADGRFVLFAHQATGIVYGQGDDAETTDVFLYDRDTGESALVSRALLSPAETGVSPRFGWASGTLSADGSTVAFTTVAAGLAADDRNSLSDAFLYDNGRIGSYFTLPPCRLLDTRKPLSGPPWPLVTNQVTVFHLYNVCGIPETAKAVAVNVTATGATGQGHLTFCRGDALTLPSTSTLGFRAGLTRASFAILPLAANAEGSLKAFPFSPDGGVVHVLIDVAGYFE